MSSLNYLANSALDCSCANVSSINTVVLNWKQSKICFFRDDAWKNPTHKGKRKEEKNQSIIRILRFCCEHTWAYVMSFCDRKGEDWKWCYEYEHVSHEN